MSEAKILEEILPMLKVKFKDTEVNAGNLITILRFAMEIVETTEAKGEEQKKLAIKLVRQMIVDAPIKDEKETLLLDIIDNGILSNTIDLVVDASKGNVNINKVVEVAATCCLSFLKK
jgi:hypothetical protein